MVMFFQHPNHPGMHNAIYSDMYDYVRPDPKQNHLKKIKHNGISLLVGFALIIAAVILVLWNEVSTRFSPSLPLLFMIISYSHVFFFFSGKSYSRICGFRGWIALGQRTIVHRSISGRKQQQACPFDRKIVHGASSYFLI